MVRIGDAFKKGRKKKSLSLEKTEEGKVSSSKEVKQTPSPAQGKSTTKRGNRYSLPKVLTENKTPQEQTLKQPIQKKKSINSKKVDQTEIPLKPSHLDPLSGKDSKNVSGDNSNISEVKSTSHDRIYDGAIRLVKELHFKQNHKELIDINEISPIVEYINADLELLDSDTCMNWVLSTPNITEGSYLYTHLINVTLLTMIIGRVLHLKKNELLNLGIGSILHDIGMLDLGNVTGKPAPLSPQELDIIKTHPLKGYNYLKKIKNIEPDILNIVWQHHERANGQGYPQGLLKEKINNFAKIVRLVDTYEAMTHWRPWRKSFLPDKAIKQILDEEKSSYEVSIMKIFLREFSIYPVGSWVELSTKEICKVLKINHDAILRPEVEVCYDGGGFPMSPPRKLNLAQHPLIFIDKSCEKPENEDRV